MERLGRTWWSRNNDQLMSSAPRLPRGKGGRDQLNRAKFKFRCLKISTVVDSMSIRAFKQIKSYDNHMEGMRSPITSQCDSLEVLSSSAAM